MKKILDIGCGKNKTEGTIGVDKIKLEGVDIIYDIEMPPLPFKDNCIDKIICNSILEHVNNLVRVMEDFYRILKPAGILVVNVPHGFSTNFITDPTHKRPFGVRTMDYFTEVGSLSYYSKARFEIVERKVILGGLGKYEWVYSWLIRMLTYLFNKNVDFAEHFFKYVPFDVELRFVLKKQGGKMSLLDSAYENFKEYSINIDPEERKKNLPIIVNSINEDLRVLEYILKLKNLKNKIILDLGCGACIPSAGIADLSPYVIGVDLSRPILKEVGDLVLDHYDVYVHRICGDFAMLPFKDNSIDIVLGGGYLHHVSDLDILLKEIKRILKKGGLLISTNEPIKTISWTSRSYTSDFDFPHFSWEWRKAFHKNGFKIKYFGIRPLGKIEPLTRNAVIRICFEIINNIHFGLVYSFVLVREDKD